VTIATPLAVTTEGSPTVDGARGSQMSACRASAAMRRTIVAAGSAVSWRQPVPAEVGDAGVADLGGGGAKRAGELVHLRVCPRGLPDVLEREPVCQPAGKASAVGAREDGVGVACIHKRLPV
jgi:hypothetical protein